MQVDLWTELELACRWRLSPGERVRMFRALGIGPEKLDACGGWIGFEWMQPDGCLDGVPQYAPADRRDMSGRWGVVIPCFAVPPRVVPPGIEQAHGIHAHDGDLIDLIAVLGQGVVATRMGNAIALGERALFDAEAEGRRTLTVIRDPLRWLLDGGAEAGAVCPIVLDDVAHVLRRAGITPCISDEEPGWQEFGAALDDAMRRAARPRPSVFVARHAAALVSAA